MSRLLEAQKVLKRAFAERRLFHAYLFRGPEGCGQFLTAQWLMQLINCQKDIKPCGECNSCYKLKQETFQDARILYPTGDAVPLHKVEAIRELIQWINLLPTEGNYRSAVVLQAEAMNPQAANSLLKTLEEAPSRAIFILISHKSVYLLPTLLSRCIPLDFKPMEQRELVPFLTESYSIPQEKAARLAQISEGCIEKAIALMQKDTQDLAEGVYSGRILEILQKGDAIDLLYLAGEASLELKTSTGNRFLDRFQRNYYEEYKKTLPLPQLEKALYAIEKAKESISARANPRLVLENLFLELSQSNKSP